MGRTYLFPVTPSTAICPLHIEVLACFYYCTHSHSTSPSYSTPNFLRRNSSVQFHFRTGRLLLFRPATLFARISPSISPTTPEKSTCPTYVHRKFRVSYPLSCIYFHQTPFICPTHTHDDSGRQFYLNLSRQSHTRTHSRSGTYMPTHPDQAFE